MRSIVATLNTMRSISQRELRNDSGAVLRAVEAGEAVIVTRNGSPVAELRPLGRPTFVPGNLLVEALTRLPAVDPRAFREDLDQALDQTLRDPWDRTDQAGSAGPEGRSA